MKKIIEILNNDGLFDIGLKVNELFNDGGVSEVVTYLNTTYNLTLTEDKLELTNNDLKKINTIDNNMKSDEESFDNIENDYLSNSTNDDMNYGTNEESDIDNARVFNMDLYKTTDKFLTRFVPYFSISILIIGFSYMFLSTMLTVTESNTVVINTTLEFVKTIMVMVVSFWVGSSVGSKSKDNFNFDDLSMGGMDGFDMFDDDNSSDKESARDYYRKYMNESDKFLTRFVPYFSVGVVIFSFVYIFYVSFFDVKSTNVVAIHSIVEFTKVIITMVVSFWVGSSIGSKLKTSSILGNEKDLM